MRSWFLSLLALAAGFAGGWLTRSNIVPAPDLHPRSESAAALATAPHAPMTAAATTPVTPVSRATLIESPQSLAASRAAVLRGLREAGVIFNAPLFDSQGLTPKAASLLGLSPAETESVNAAYLAASKAIDDARAKGVSAERSADGNTLLVRVPAIDVATSRSLFDQFQNTLATTLGPERQALLSELAGPQIPLSFQNFGLNDLSYDVHLQAQPQTLIRSGRTFPLVQYERRFSDPTGARGTSQNMGTFSDVKKNDPLLAPFIPPEFRDPTEP